MKPTYTVNFYKKRMTGRSEVVFSSDSLEQISSWLSKKVGYEFVNKPVWRTSPFKGFWKDKLGNAFVVYPVKTKDNK